MTSTTRTVMVVEDTRSQMAFIRAYLRQARYDVVEAYSGEEARGRADEQPLDAILLDWELGDCVGPDLIPAWQEDPVLGDVPIIMMTADRDATRISTALDLGAVDFLAKPIHPVELAARLRSAMRINDLQARLRREATHDHLTGLPNRRMFLERLEMELTRATRYARELSVALLDIDHFKAVNDTHGHDVGDACLRALADYLAHSVRSADLVARWGGEEFVILLPETDADHAFLAIDRFRSELPADLAPPTEVAPRTTFSAGVSSLGGRQVGGELLLKEADLALYDAKREGRNVVHVAPAA